VAASVKRTGELGGTGVYSSPDECAAEIRRTAMTVLGFSAAQEITPAAFVPMQRAISAAVLTPKGVVAIPQGDAF